MPIVPTGDYDLAPPEAASLAESLRAFSYDLPSAVADLVDNSLTAHARNVWIDFFWSGGDSVISVTDDGDGMSASQLVQAMRPGSQSPRVERAEHDLGRFGLGMKTASFSQCRKVTVRTKAEGGSPATRCWDLDHIAQVNEWQLLRAADEQALKHMQRLNSLGHGTTVLWQRLDRVVHDYALGDEAAQRRFYDEATAVKQQLSMVFHRMMEGTHRVSIHLNDNPVAPWDPFLAANAATQNLGTEHFRIRAHDVEVTAFVLPHHSKLSKKEHDDAGGPRGWNAHQGFFVYRNKRLLVPGGWLNLGWRQEDHYKLARIRIDIPNATDDDWGIDVTKSKASPPSRLREELRRIAGHARSRAKDVYRHRGAKLTPTLDSEKVFLWEPKAKNDRTFYKLNRDHPLVEQALSATSNPKALKALLRLIEETIPVPHITITHSEAPDSHGMPFSGAKASDISATMEQAFDALLSSGYSVKHALERLAMMWPFELYPELLQALYEDKSNGGQP